MPISLAQVSDRLQAAWAAVNLGELSYMHEGHQTVFQTLDGFQRHIEWLMGLEKKLQEEADALAGTATAGGGALLTRFVEES